MPRAQRLALVQSEAEETWVLFQDPPAILIGEANRETVSTPAQAHPQP